MTKSVVIIGGGLGGLFTGAILANEGMKVTLLEKNKTIGGGLQNFKRDGQIFDTGMHILGGFQKGGSLNKICTYLEILNSLALKDVDKECMDSITYLSDNKSYRIPGGKENFIEYFSNEFPEETENIRAYVDSLYAIANEVDMFYLRRGSDMIFSHSEQFLMPADKFIAKFIHSKRLRDILAYMNPMYGGMAGHTPAYIHALINVLYIDGTTRFVDGSQQLASLLKNCIEGHGGEVVDNCSVIGIETSEREIVEVSASNNKKYSADCYISAIHPCALIKLFNDEKALPKSYRTRLSEIPNTYSSFTVFIVFKKNSFNYINHTCYVQEDYGMVWNHGEYNSTNWPRGFMYMTPPVKEQGEYANKMIINCIMEFDNVRKWEETKTGERGEEYKNWKAEQVEKILAVMEKLHPKFKESVQSIYSASPLTIRDFYNVKEGSLFGFRKDCQNIALSQVPVYTKIHNLYLTGQNINLHGICGVPLTAINTAEAILGTNTIIDKINKKYNQLYGDN